MPKYDVFLSHNSQDKPAVEELARRLTKAGIQPWLDKWNLIPGEPWQEAIEEALDNCATCAVFVGASGTGPWQNEEMRAAVQRRVDERRADARPFRVIPILLPGAERDERSRLPAFLVAATWVEFRRTLDDKDAFHRLACGIRGIEPGPAPGEAIYEGECPYRGLRFFDVEHTPFFFGREALTGWLLNELRPSNGSRQTNRFLAVIGASGSGKSSLARAGLVAALKRGEIEGSDQWPIAICRPGPDPLESLAVTLNPYTLDDPLDLVDKLRQDERRLHITTRLAMRDAPPEHRLVVLVDQFEEIFTLCHDEELGRALISNLLYAAGVVQGQTIVLLTLRADFYGKCALYPSLAAALSDHQVLVGPMTNDELRRAIERPAQLAGGEFEAGLVEGLLRDVNDQPGGLPLLQHALLELWGRREGRRLTHTAYKAIGGVEGALERQAEGVYARFAEPEKEICRRVFLRLTQPGEGTKDTKRRVPFQELMPAEGEYAAIEAVVHALAGADARLITLEVEDELKGEQFIEVAHEALIRGWTRLREWIEEDREALRIHRHLTEATNEWQANENDAGFLYRGARLARARDWVKVYAHHLNPLEREFLEISQQVKAETMQSTRLRQEAIETADQLQEMDRLKNQFMANMSHELRTPLNSIIGFSSVILKGIDGSLTDMQRTDLEAVYNSGQHLLELINGIVDIFKIKAGKMELSFEDTNLREVIKVVTSTAIALVKDKPIELQQSIPQDLPIIRADPRCVRQILINLVGNASKFTEEGFIRVEVKANSTEVIIAVADSGIGIPEDKVGTIFEEFTRVDDFSTPVGSTGQGLTIARHLVEKHGGRIWVESVVDVGSTFYVALPIAGPPAEGEEEEKTEIEAEGTEERSTEEKKPGRKTVLCVDDDDGVIMLFRHYLSKQGYRVIGITESTLVMEIARRIKPFAITLDVMMPEKDGWQVIQELKSHPDTRDIPVIMCSIIADQDRGVSLGASDYLVKPIMESELVTALERLDKKHRVLIVDDQARDRNLLRRMIESQDGYQVVEAAGGQEAIVLVQQIQPNIIILDLMMPDVDGFAVLEHLKMNEQTQHIPVIIVTAKTLTLQDRDWLQQRAEALFQKGLFEQDELLEEVIRALEQIDFAGGE